MFSLAISDSYHLAGDDRMPRQPIRGTFRPVLVIAVCMIVMRPASVFAEAAVAFGQYGLGEWASGSARNMPSSEEAQSAAISSCSARGANCVVVKTFNKSCIAVAAQDGDNEFSVRVNRDLNAARGSALAACEESGLPCMIAEAFCDNVSEAEIVAAERRKNEEENKEFQEQLHSCFAASTGERDASGAIAACDQAATFPRLQPSDRIKLTQQRSNLVALQESLRQKQAREEQESRERMAREQKDRAQQEQRERDHREAQRPAEGDRAVAHSDIRTAGKTGESVANAPAPPAAADAMPGALGGIPLSTWITGGVAGMLGVALGAVLMRQRQHWPLAITHELRRVTRLSAAPTEADTETAAVGLKRRAAIDEPAIAPDEVRSQTNSTPRAAPAQSGESRTSALVLLASIIGSRPAFVPLYLLFMIPTYYLGFFGSNSLLLNAVGQASGMDLSPQFWMHFGAMLVLCALTWMRGRDADKYWIVIFPLLASVFDFVPVLSSIPLIPTVMHLLAIIIGVSAPPAQRARVAGGAPR